MSLYVQRDFEKKEEAETGKRKQKVKLTLSYSQRLKAKLSDSFEFPAEELQTEVYSLRSGPRLFPHGFSV